MQSSAQARRAHLTHDTCLFEWLQNMLDCSQAACKDSQLLGQCGFQHLLAHARQHMCLGVTDAMLQQCMRLCKDTSQQIQGWVVLYCAAPYRAAR